MTTPYAGNDGNFVDAAAVIDGSDAPSSAIFNTCFEGALDRTAFLFRNVMGLRGSSWSRPVVVGAAGFTANLAFTSPEYDGTNRQWMQLTVGSAGSTGRIYLSYDGLDETWRAFASDVTFGAGSVAAACAKDPNDTTTYHIASIGIPTTQEVEIWTGTASGFTRTYQEGTQTYGDVQAASLNGYAIFATGGSTAGATNFITSPDKMVTPTVANVGATCGAVPRWLMRVGYVSGTPTLLAVPCGASFATPFVYTSTDGHTFTQQTSGFGSHLLATDTIVGVDSGLDSNGSCFLMLVKTTAGAGKVLKSVDGINWSTVATITALGPAVSLAAAGRLWVAVLGATSPAPQRLVYSPDTVNWYTTDAYLAQGGSANAFVRSNYDGTNTIASQIVAANKFGTRCGLIAGHTAGPMT